MREGQQRVVAENEAVDPVGGAVGLDDPELAAIGRNTIKAKSRWNCDNGVNSGAYGTCNADCTLPGDIKWEFGGPGAGNTGKGKKK